MCNRAYRAVNSSTPKKDHHSTALHENSIPSHTSLCSRLTRCSGRTLAVRSRGHTAQSSLSSQKLDLATTCPMRGSFALITTPKLRLLIKPVGVWNWA